ncbi:MAG: TolC family protein [Saprospiraceae bacterium]
MFRTHFKVSRIIKILLFVCFGHLASAQNVYRLTLDEVVALAQSDAPDALLASTRWKHSYWTYQSYLADFKPQIVLNANTLPLFNRSIEPIIQPNGSLIYLRRSYMENQLNLALQQDFAPTGGTLFFGSGLRRLDQFANSQEPSATSYLSNPLSLEFNQPLFQYNAMKWRKKIEPIIYKESEKQYSEQMEAVANKAASLFFDLLISQLDAHAALQDKANADTLLTLSNGRYEVGKIAETDLLQVQLNAMQAETRQAEAQLNMQTNTEQLRDFLDLQGDVQFDLVPPYEIPTVAVDEKLALEFAMQNRSTVVGFDRRLEEARREIARSQGETGVSASVGGQFGLTQTGAKIDRVYTDLLDQEVFTIGLTVPIADWGKSKARRAVAQSNLELEQKQVEQERENFRHVVTLRAHQFDLIRRNAEVAQRYFDAARKRYDITYQRYLIGKIGITDLNLALADQEGARIGYLQSIRDFWMALFDIRGLTLYDFVNDRSLMLSTPKGN